MAVNKGANFTLTAQNRGGAAMKQFQQQLQGIQTTTRQMAPVNQSWNKGLSENRRAIQQLGFQMTDFTVQIAGGQNAMLAFIQQGGQMLQVFGPVGAILATLLTVFGTLALVIGKSGKSLSELTPIVGVLTDQFAWLASTFRAATDVLIGAINLILNHLDVLLIAAMTVAGWFALGWVSSMIKSSMAVRALILSVALLGPNLRTATIVWTASLGSMTVSAAAATIATQTLTLATGALRASAMALGSALASVSALLMRFLPVALLLGVSWLIERLIALRQAGISWGEIMHRVGNLVAALFVAMGIAAEGMGNAVLATFQLIMAGAGDMVMWIFDKWNGLMEVMSGTFNGWMEAIGSPIRMQVDAPDWYTNGRAGIDAWRSSAEAGFAAAGAAGEEAAATIGTAWSNMFEGIKDNTVDVRDWFGGAGKDKAGGAGDAVKKTKEEADKIKKIFEDLKSSIYDSMMTGFKAVIAGTKSLKDYAVDMLNTVLDKILDIMWQPVFDKWSGGLAGGIMSLFGMKSFAGGGDTGNGSRSGGLDGKGGFMAMLHPKETVIDHTKKNSALDKRSDGLDGKGGLMAMLGLNSIMGGSSKSQVGSAPTVVDKWSGGMASLFDMPSFEGGGGTGDGSRSGGLDGKGGFMALLHPKETVIDHAKGQTSAGGTERTIHVVITEGETFGARVEAIADDRAIKITRAGIKEYDHSVLPMSVRRVQSTPRNR